MPDGRIVRRARAWAQANPDTAHDIAAITAFGVCGTIVLVLIWGLGEIAMQCILTESTPLHWLGAGLTLLDLVVCVALIVYCLRLLYRLFRGRPW